MQVVWTYIDEISGKGLEISTIMLFFSYQIPKIMPMVIPLTILLASIMSFGNLAEKYELAAMKSAGVSLQRAMKGLIAFILIISSITFFFSNNIIPYANYKATNLRSNIKKKKPALAIEAGIFNKIGAYIIRVASKSGENGQFLKDIIIHQNNYNTILAKTGELKNDKGTNILQLILYDGQYQEEYFKKKHSIKEKNQMPAVFSTFKKHIINIDVSELDNVDLEHNRYDQRHNMLNIGELNYTIDSLNVKLDTTYLKLTRATNIYLGFKKVAKDSISINKKFVEKGILASLKTDDNRVHLIQSALNKLENQKTRIKSNSKKITGNITWINLHKLELHKKFSLAFACIVLFFIGAPLGALIRKGGMGFPLILAMLIFLVYYFMALFAENMATKGSLNPVLAAWFAPLVMLPFGVLLTKKATSDAGLINISGLLNFFRKLIPKKKKALS
jgi:lipopolysaccharide export system permease protein